MRTFSRAKGRIDTSTDNEFLEDDNLRGQAGRVEAHESADAEPESTRERGEVELNTEAPSGSGRRGMAGVRARSVSPDRKTDFSKWLKHKKRRWKEELEGRKRMR